MSEQTLDEKIKNKFNPGKPKLNPKAKVKKVIAIMSGKGGVGKSLVTSLVASSIAKRDYQVGIMDADMTGPSIPASFGLSGQAYATEKDLMLPRKTNTNIQVMSINLLLEDTTTPVIWRGPVVSDMVNKFWTQVYWDDVDYLFVDMPPGTGDVPLTVFNNLPVDGVIIATSPQDMVSMIVSKAINMVNQVGLPILGIVENMSYFVCDNCDKKHYIFGESHIEDIANKYGIDTIIKLPLDARIAKAVDEGKVETLSIPDINPLLEKVEKL